MKIKVCANCRMKVVPKPDGTCPACHVAGAFEGSHLEDQKRTSVATPGQTQQPTQQSEVNGLERRPEPQGSLIGGCISRALSILAVIIAATLAMIYSCSKEELQRRQKEASQPPEDVSPVLPKYAPLGDRDE